MDSTYFAQFANTRVGAGPEPLTAADFDVRGVPGAAPGVYDFDVREAPGAPSSAHDFDVREAPEPQVAGVRRSCPHCNQEFRTPYMAVRHKLSCPVKGRAAQ